MRSVERTSGDRPPSVVPRTSLFERLDAALEGGLILVSAPAGSGKTVLLRSWIDAAGLRDRTAWLSVERDERDGQRFWLSAVAAIRAATGAGGPIDALAPAPEFDGSAVVERIAAGAASLQDPVLLVIDDLHHLLEPAALGQVELLLARRPPQLRIVLATRHDPPIGLHRYRLSGELTEVRASDLRLDREEACQLLSGAGITLSDDSVDALVARTEGWVAGIRLAALSMAGHTDPERFVAEFSGSERTVADYLVAEVLQRQTEPVRQLLLRTSILERVSGPLADRLTGATGSDRTLLALEDANAFVVALDRERTWFRFHGLFADLLLLELRRTHPDAVPGLNRAAAEWHAEHGLIVDAIRHAQAAGDWRFAGDLMGRNGFSIALDGSYATMTRLLGAFPPDALANPELAAFLAYGEAIRPALDTAASYIAVAERHASEVPEERRRRFAAMLATTRLTIARWRGDYGTIVSDVRALLEPVEADTVGDVAAGNDVRAVALMNLGAVELWSGAGDDAQRHLEEALALARRNGRPYVEMGCLGHLSIAAARHSLADQRALAAETLALMDRFGWASEPIAPMVLAMAGAADVWQGRFDDADPWLDRAERALRPNAEPAKELTVRYARGIQRLGQGRLAQAIAELESVDRVQAQMVEPNPLAIQALGLQVQARVRVGDLPGAAVALEGAADAVREHAETRSGYAAVQLARHEARTAIQELEPVLSGAAPRIHEFSTINALLLDALARDALGDAPAAEDGVERALELAESDALILPFLVTPASELLGRHPRHRTAHAALLANILDVLGGSALRPRTGEPQALQEPLTESELRVLRFLPSNLSAPEIAAEMFLSTSTVKTHMNHIYEKLGAHKRTEAVELARALGLLGPSGRGRG